MRYAPLRAIADTPVLPVPQQQRRSAGGETLSVLDMKVKNIETDGEMSVYATAGYNGALIMAVEAGSLAEQRGLAANDVIVAWGGDAINRITDLEGRVLDDRTPVAVLRKQKKIIL